jgi:hypothetical protein
MLLLLLLLHLPWPAHLLLLLLHRLGGRQQTAEHS